MAELEISKHAKQAYTHMTNSSTPLKHRISELVIEIAIIVFAVSISIWFHSIGEHMHEQEQVKSFLVGLKKDLQVDAERINKNMAGYQTSVDQFKYLSGLNPAGPVDNEKIDHAFDIIEDPLFMFMANKARYESFKSSGKLSNIENEDLLQHITTYYEYALPAIHQGEEYWGKNSANLNAFLADANNPTSREIRFKLVTSPKGKHICDSLTSSPVGDYRGTLALLDHIIKEIDRAYPESGSAK